MGRLVKEIRNAFDGMNSGGMIGLHWHKGSVCHGANLDCGMDTDAGRSGGEVGYGMQRPRCQGVRSILAQGVRSILAEA